MLSADQKSVYVTGREKASSVETVWKWSAGGSNPEKFVDNCGIVSDVDPGGQYLPGIKLFAEKTGIYEVSISDRKCIPLIPGVELFNAQLPAMTSRSCMSCFARRSHDLPSGLEVRKTHRDTPGRVEGSLCFSPRLHGR